MFSSQLLPQHPLMAREEAEKAELDAMRRFLAIELIESLLRCSRFAHADKDKEPMNTQYDNDKYIECPCENATHVYFAGNVHLIAKEKQDVFWCDVGGGYFQFYAPGKHNSSFYTAWYPGDVHAFAQGPIFLKEKELEVEFHWGAYYAPNVLVAAVGGVATVSIDFKTQCICKSGETNDPNPIKFDDSWSLDRIKNVAADYARKIARCEA